MEFTFGMIFTFPTRGLCLEIREEDIWFFKVFRGIYVVLQKIYKYFDSILFSIMSNDIIGFELLEYHLTIG